MSDTPDPTPVDRARDALRDGLPDAALEHLRGVEHPDAHWIRAVASAASGDPVRVHLAVRALSRAGAWPSAPTRDVAHPFAAAVCEDAPQTAAWRVLATAVLAMLGKEAPPTDLNLAWELAVLDADLATDTDRASRIVALAALRRRMKHLDAARDLARGAQDAAVAAMDADAYVAASNLLADICADEGDLELAASVRRHAERRLELGWDGPTRRRLVHRLRPDNVDTGVNPGW